MSIVIHLYKRLVYTYYAGWHTATDHTGLFGQSAESVFGRECVYHLRCDGICTLSIFFLEGVLSEISRSVNKAYCDVLCGLCRGLSVCGWTCGAAVCAQSATVIYRRQSISYLVRLVAL